MKRTIRTAVATLALTAAASLMTACGSDPVANPEQCERDVIKVMRQHAAAGTTAASDGSEKPMSCAGLSDAQLEDVANAAAIALLTDK